jgi:asparagine synthase (glutamine-hydrolysing)
MKFVVCLLDPEGHRVPDETRRAYESLPGSRRLDFSWREIGQVSVLVAGATDGTGAMFASNGNGVAIGAVRLDNRAELQELSRSESPDLSDLEIVLHTVMKYGTRCIQRILGDFAFMVWSSGTGRAIAACDPFGVKKLYFSQQPRLLAFASRAEMLSLGGEYELQYLAERVAGCQTSEGLSVYAGVRAVPAGCMVAFERGAASASRYWSAAAFDHEATRRDSEREVVETCRHLLAESVRLRLSGEADTWAQLSGGLDSSSVVSIAQWLRANGVVSHGLAGTVSFVDSHGTGADEREYSDAVATKWQLRNETIVDPPLWQDERYSPPYTDEPSALLPAFPRDQRLCEIVRRSGGRVLLTGVAGDELFTGNMFFFADWIAQGRFAPALREMAHRAASGRVSFWELAYRNAALPLLPQIVQQRLVRDDGEMPPWVARRTARRYQLRARAAAPFSYAGRIGKKYQDAIVRDVMGISSGLSIGLIEESLDVRHPFLYRPLVEFALRLPPEFCARPNMRKWLLREVMKGILPETVRTRIGKGIMAGLVAWSMATQASLLETLVQNPILADLGIVDGKRLGEWFRAAQRERANREKLSAAVQYTLAIEAWLQMRAGRWPLPTHHGTAASVNQHGGGSVRNGCNALGGVKA